MKINDFIRVLNSDFFTGVPDSLLKPLCNYLTFIYGTDSKHNIIAANEGNAVALAAGYYMSTGRVPVIYMQNSGEGNIINPLASLMNEKVYAIPAILVIGWRGEPGVHDEPQHIYQGEVTLKLLEDMSINYFVIEKDTSDFDVAEAMSDFSSELSKGHQVAFVVRKGALTDAPLIKYENNNKLIREEVIRHIIEASGEDIIVSTTGKASRELFEIREANKQSHKYDFLTVGSMGHSSSIALGIALNKPNQKIWCVDGDGALLMHMGAMATIGSMCPNNFIHIVINNESHETVGGMATVAGNIDIVGIAKACGYKNAYSINDYDLLDKILNEVRGRDELSLLEVKCGIGSRSDLGRPTTTTIENKVGFMSYLNELN